MLIPCQTLGLHFFFLPYLILPSQPTNRQISLSPFLLIRSPNQEMVESLFECCSLLMRTKSVLFLLLLLPPTQMRSQFHASMPISRPGSLCWRRAYKGGRATGSDQYLLKDGMASGLIHHWKNFGRKLLQNMAL